MTDLDKSALPKKPWNEPRVEILDVADSEGGVGRGGDGFYFPDSTKS